MAAWLAGGEACIDRLWSELPEEWLIDSYGDPRCTLDKQGLKGVLLSVQMEFGPNQFELFVEGSGIEETYPNHQMGAVIAKLLALKSLVK
jgi:hypothetical protein